MQCTDTSGQLPAVHIPDEVIELAQELRPIIESIRTYGHGEGSITLKVQHGHIPVIEWAVRKFRTARKRQNS